MHSFAKRCFIATECLINLIDKNEKSIIRQLAKSGATRHIINVRAMTFLRVSHAVGMFSTFEAELQEYFSLQQSNAFTVTKDALERAKHEELSIKLTLYKDAINVLKHGHGRSYDKLLKNDNLPFKIPDIEVSPFDDVDVCKINILIDVDNKFLRDCVSIIDDVSIAIGLR